MKNRPVFTLAGQIEAIYSNFNNPQTSFLDDASVQNQKRSPLPLPQRKTLRTPPHSSSLHQSSQA